MWLQIYSALLLESSKGSWNICLSLGSCVRYIFFFFTESNFSGSHSSLISRLSVCLLFVFPPG